MKNTAMIAALMVAAGVSANAATVDSFGFATTAWTETLTVDKADPAAGTLVSATFTLLGKVSGNARAESLDQDTATITLDLKGEVKATSGSLLITTLPVVSETFNASAFDGTLDFGGTSGVSFADLMADDTDSITITDAAILATLVGPGSIDWIVTATGLSTASGAGNLISQFGTAGFAELSVEYTYAPVNPIPLPASVLFLAGGLGALGLMKARKRA